MFGHSNQTLFWNSWKTKRACSTEWQKRQVYLEGKISINITKNSQESLHKSSRRCSTSSNSKNRDTILKIWLLYLQRKKVKNNYSVFQKFSSRNINSSISFKNWLVLADMSRNVINSEYSPLVFAVFWWGPLRQVLAIFFTTIYLVYFFNCFWIGLSLTR